MRKLNRSASTLIYADEEVPYALIKNILHTLQETRTLRFHLVVHMDMRADYR